jgi:serine/threonine protein phosphatase PrpC
MASPTALPQILLVNADDTEPQVFSFAGGQAAVFSRRCPAKSGANEDAAALLAFGNNSGLLAIADGCGGMASGELASRLAIESLESSLPDVTDSPQTLRAAVLDAFEKANRMVLEIGSGAATTLAVVEVDAALLRTYHVGDSTILLIGNRGKVRMMTTSHSPVGYAVQAGMLDEHEAIHHEDRHLVSNVIGSEHFHIEIGSKRRIHPRDTVVVGSDGLFDNLLLNEIVELVRKGPLETAARRVAEVATQRMDHPTEDLPSKPDDLTFILFRPGRRQPPASA